MSLSITIDDERALTKEMFVLGLGGVTAGILSAGLALIAGEYVPQLMVLAFAAVVGLFGNYADRMVERGHFRLGLSVLAGIVWALLLSFGALWAAAAGGALLGASLYGAADKGTAKKPMHRVWISGLYGLAMVLAVFTTETFMAVGFLRELTHTVVPEVVMGSTWGVFLCAAAMAGRLELKRDEIVADYRATIASVGLAERTLLAQGLGVYCQLREEFERSEDRGFVEAAIPVAEDVARNLLVLARRTDALRRSNVADDFIHLEARIARTAEQLARAEDEALRRELCGVRDELEAQLCARKELRATCARFEARQHRCITSLERLQVALIQNSSLGMEHVDLKDALNSLQDLAEEIRWRGGWEIQDARSDLADVSENGLVGEREQETQHNILSDHAI